MHNFTHLTRNSDGFEEVVIELPRTLLTRLLCRNHLLTFVKLKQGWSYKETGEVISDEHFTLLADCLWSKTRAARC